ncbi:hypothetical protein SDJN02_01681, partial [Cucurbita argyrosperma subsp. argyrosperma]
MSELLEVDSLLCFEPISMAIPALSPPEPRFEYQEEEDPVSPAQNPNFMDQQQLEEGEGEVEQNQFDPPQSSETLTLELPDPRQNSPQEDPQDPELQVNENFVNDHDPSDQGESNALSSRIIDINALVSSAAVSRRLPKGKKWSMKRRFLKEKSQKKFEILVGTFKPIPFVPDKILDFSSHEKLLKRLGLWDFVHTKFDRSVRFELLLQLVANFNHSQRYSYVNGVRIMVNRADLARALRLPVKKSMIMEDGEEYPIASEESIAFIEDFVSNWLLLHEDTWMMPNEVLNWTKAIKIGNFERVDWAGLIWFMVEKELIQSPQLVNCYYASHLQCLIRSQRADLLKEEASKVEEVEIKEEVEQEPEQEQDDEDGVCNESPKMVGNDDSMVKNLEEHSVELCLGRDNVDKVDVQKETASVGDMMDLLDSKEEEEEEEEEQGQWLSNGNDNGLDLLLRRCHTNEFKEFDFGDDKKVALEEGDDQRKEEQEEQEEQEELEEQEEQFCLLPTSNPIDGFPSSQFVQEMETEPITFNSEFELHCPSSVECVPFVNSNKRVIDPDDIDNPAQSLNKRLRSEGPLDYGNCMDNVQQWLDKARMISTEKEQVHRQATVNQQYLLHELQQRDTFIEHLRRTKFEEQRKMQSDIYGLERELYVMGTLLDGYRKALRETHKAFAEYRARCPQFDEPLYKDVAGSGGLVLSTMELERMRLKQAEEDKLSRLVIEKRFKSLEDKFVDVFHGHLEEVSSLDRRLLEVFDQVQTMRESFTNRKASEASESISNE